MLQSLIQIGQQVSQGRNEWDDIIDFPDVSKERDKNFRLYVAEMCFDIDESEILLKADSLREYSDDSPSIFKSIKIQGGNNKAIYTCVYAPKSLEQFRKTFFGVLDKEGKTPDKGQFVEAIEKDFAHFNDSKLANALKAIFKLREQFEARFIDLDKNIFSLKNLSEELSLDKMDSIVLLYASIKSNELGVNEPLSLSNLDGYEDFIRAKFLSRSENNTGDKKLCYATGLMHEDVGEIAFNSRYNINKMFVTTTRNYASEFSNDAFSLNYQASAEVQKLLERGSEYVLNNHTVLIAGVNHCIIPQVFSQSKIDSKALLGKLSKRSEFLFRSQETKDLIEEIEDTDSDIYWIDFLGYESDGNFFKTINYIKDVSKTHFMALIDTFRNVDRSLKNVDGIEWNNVMSIGKDNRLALNFQTLYTLIPLRKDKEKKNEALILFKAILEQRKISNQKLFEHYRDLILCHRFHRYKSYNNIYAPSTINDKTSHFDYAVRDATYQYLAIFQVLKQLNLLKDMEETTIIPEITTEPTETYQQQIDKFFEKMEYSDAQKAMFYLGRTVNAVAYAQVKKDHSSKPILDKINFNGLEAKHIIRLNNDLMEKTKQYRIYDKTEYSLSLFTKYFTPNSWSLSAEEALFFLLSGYSFSTKAKSNNQ